MSINDVIEDIIDSTMDDVDDASEVTREDADKLFEEAEGLLENFIERLNSFETRSVLKRDLFDDLRANGADI